MHLKLIIESNGLAGWAKNSASDSAAAPHRQQEAEYPLQSQSSDWLDNETFESYYPNSGSSGVVAGSKAPGKLNLSQFDNITDAVGRLSFNQKKPVKAASSHVSHGDSDHQQSSTAASDPSGDHMFKVMPGTLF